MMDRKSFLGALAALPAAVRALVDRPPLALPPGDPEPPDADVVPEAPTWEVVTDDRVRHVPGGLDPGVLSIDGEVVGEVGTLTLRQVEPMDVTSNLEGSYREFLTGPRFLLLEDVRLLDAAGTLLQDRLYSEDVAEFVLGSPGLSPFGDGIARGCVWSGRLTSFSFDSYIDRRDVRATLEILVIGTVEMTAWS